MLGCSTSTPAHPCNATLDGGVFSVGTISFAARSAAAFEYTEPDQKSIFAVVAISAALDACAEGKAQSASASSATELTLQINYAHAGTFCVDNFGSNCAWARILVGSGGADASPAKFFDGGGTLTLTAVDLDHVAGTYDLVFSTGEKLTGAFDAPTCNVRACTSP